MSTTEIVIEAIPFCKKPGLINSVSMEGDKIDTVFPVIADTDWECVALLCGNGRMPDTAQERIDIYEKIMLKVKEKQGHWGWHCIATSEISFFDKGTATTKYKEEWVQSQH